MLSMFKRGGAASASLPTEVPTNEPLKGEPTMHSGTTPFEIEIHTGNILLSGDLDGSREVLDRCRAVFSYISGMSRRTWTIEANDIRIIPEGVTTWIQVVEEFFKNSELVYAPSQLNVILRYDERYRHATSTFQEFGSACREAAVEASW